MTKDTCVFCDSSVTALDKLGPADKFDCSLCGAYNFPYHSQGDQALQEKIKNNRHLLAGYLLETKPGRKEGGQDITSDTVASILRDPLIPRRTMQKLEKLLLYCYDKTNRIGEGHEDTTIPPSAAYAKNGNEVRTLLTSMRELEWVQYAWNSWFCLTVKGFDHAETLLMSNPDSTKVFVAMQFSEDLLAAHEKAIIPACEACGFQAFTIKEKDPNDGITDEIIVSIKQSKFVIVDFTYNNCGAYFEAGYAQGQGLQVIRCCKAEWFDGSKKETRPHFDVQHYNFIIWKDHADLQKRLKDRIRVTIPGAKLEDAPG